MHSISRYNDWFRQAENDLEWAKYSMKGGFYAQVCFVCQQCAEKALKAFCLSQGYDAIRTHSLFQIIKSLGENGELERCARELDIYYISARYPDALPAGAPFELMSMEQASRALESAETIIDVIRKRLP